MASGFGLLGLTMSIVGLYAVIAQSVAQRTGIDYEDLKRVAAERTPLRRTGRPEDIAGVICFLCSDDASFVTGQTIYASGGP